ncbi:cell division protein FtsQ/DivIB [uncultured Amnibacterium sp.]|uniref:cell division protein FtsQ/DivIB n=1 Tax=uncultured Amnibacterium sp. TaxID=1631851 RepID=UPI0035CBAEE1
MPQRTAPGPPVPLPVAHDAHPPRSARDDRRAIRAAVRRRRRAEAAERRGAGARRPRLVLTAVLGVGVLLVGVPAALAFGPVFPVRTIAVRGASDALAAQVRQALAGELGRPVALVDDAQVAAALAAVPAVERFTLVRRPPDTIELVVVPRTPVAQQRTASGWAQVDAAHVVVSTAPARTTLPVVTVPQGADRPAAAYASATAALAALAGTFPAVSDVTATSPDDVVLTLAGGLRVRWGGAEDGEAKAEALHAALRSAAKGATRLDVSSPGVVLTR